MDGCIKGEPPPFDWEGKVRELARSHVRSKGLQSDITRAQITGTDATALRQELMDESRRLYDLLDELERLVSGRS